MISTNQDFKITYMKNIPKLESKDTENVFYVCPKNIYTKQQRSNTSWDLS